MELQEFWKNCLKKWQDRKMKLLESWKKPPQKWQERKKKFFINFIERWDKKSNSVKVLCAAILSAIIFLLICLPVIICSSEDSVGFWNFIILIVSAPVAFVIWQFRDENSRQQIENQRKDINLKEFQKLSEWVSGAHLPEIKIVEKNITKSSFTTDNESAASPEKKITEQTEECSKEYGQKPDTAHSDTFGKWDGAVALQISAIYNLLPFFRGDYGESFRLPAFNLLKSAWQAMQQESLNELVEVLSNERQREIIDKLKQKAQSPMGVALTHVLLSLNRESTRLNLQDFPEMLPNICLAGINFNFSKIKEKAIDLSQLNLNGADLRAANLSYANLHDAKLSNANLSYAELHSTILSNAELRRAKLSNANLKNATDLSNADLNNAELTNADLSNANLRNTKLINTDLSNANLRSAKLSNADLHLAKLSNADLFDADLSDAKLDDADLLDANLLSTDLRRAVFTWMELQESRFLFNAKISINNFSRYIYPYWKQTDSQIWEKLTEPEQKAVMQTFCNETGMIIFDDKENAVVAKPES